MGVKPHTLQRRIAEWGINMRTSYSTISDEKLDEYITAARKQFPNFGLKYNNFKMFNSRCGVGLMRYLIYF